MDSAGVERAGRILVAPAMEHDAPKLPFRLACEWLSSSRVVRPSVVNVLERVPATPTRARRETRTRVAHLPDGRRRAELD